MRYYIFMNKFRKFKIKEILLLSCFVFIVIIVILNIKTKKIEKFNIETVFEKTEVSEIPEKYTCLSGSNVYETECMIDMLDRASAEREWKQRKLETAKHPEINIYDLATVLENEQEKIRKLREDFEKFRDLWCEAEMAFFSGSGTPQALAKCELKLELLAIKNMDKIYHDLIEEVYDSDGIPDFQPSEADIDSLTKTNKTKRGCVWAGEEEGCD